MQREGQKLAKLVEGASANRPVPIVSFVARQRDLREMVGTHITGAEQLNFADVLNHWEGRFHTIRLEDRNLPDIAEKRVLKPKNADARRQLDEAFEKVRRERESVLNVLLTTKATPEMFRKVYPFSPALVETLVAVSSALQRERTALKVMLELLVQQRDTLELGQIIPVGDLFDIVAFGEEAFSDVMRMNFENARRLYRDKLLPLLEEEHGAAADPGPGGHGAPPPDPAAAARRRSFRADDRLMKTVLLAALVPEVESLKNLTGERLAALNHGSLKTPIPGQEKSLVIQRFRRWAGRVGEIRLGGDTANPVISLQLTGVDTESILVQAQAEDNRGNRQLMIRRLIFEALDVRTPEEAFVQYDVTWRGTRRPVQLLYANVRELTDHALESEGEGWKVVIDWPFDEAGFGPHDDAARLERYARDVGRSARTILWLPSFFSNNAMKELGTLVKLEYVLSGERFGQYSQHLAATDRPVARQLLSNQRSALRHKMLEWLEMVFGVRNPAAEVLDAVVEASDHVQTLCAGFHPRPPVGADFKTALRHILDQALSFQYPAHPSFEPDDREIKPQQLKTVWEQLARAVEATDGRLFVEERVRAQVRQVVIPMRIGDMGETHFVVGRQWLSHFNRKIDEHGRAIPTVRDLWEWMDEPQPMGLQPPFRNLLVKLFVEQTKRSFVRGGIARDPGLEDVQGDMELQTQNLPEETDWKKATALAEALLRVPPPRTLNAASVARFQAAVREAVGTYHECGSLIDKLTILMREVGLDDTHATSRMKTARAARDFVATCETADDVALVTRIATARIETNEDCMRASLETTHANVAALLRVQMSLFRALGAMNDSRQDRAEAILESLRETLSTDELGAKLEPALKRAADATASLLAATPPPPPLPPVPPPPPPLVVTPPPPQMRVQSSGEKRALGMTDARQVLERLLSELPEEGQADLAWTVWKKETR